MTVATAVATPAPAPTSTSTPFLERFRRELALPTAAPDRSLAADALILHCTAPQTGVAVLAMRHPASITERLAAVRAYANAHTAVRAADWVALAATYKDAAFSAPAAATLREFARASGLDSCCTPAAASAALPAVAARYLACYVANWSELVPALYAADGVGPHPNEVMRRGIAAWVAAHPAVDERVLADAVRASSK
jgi:hypothetical protein